VIQHGGGHYDASGCRMIVGHWWAVVDATM
jgi:hypothetical protein